MERLDLQFENHSELELMAKNLPDAVALELKNRGEQGLADKVTDGEIDLSEDILHFISEGEAAKDEAAKAESTEKNEDEALKKMLNYNDEAVPETEAEAETIDDAAEFDANKFFIAKRDEIVIRLLTEEPEEEIEAKTAA